LNCNHPVVRDLVCEALRYWVTEMHVDGFRFDLASILGAARTDQRAGQPALLEHLAYDPVLAHQADRRGLGCGGALSGGHVSGLGPLGRVERQVPRRSARFVRGEEGMVSALATGW
jgi:isoamylase